MYSRGRTAIRLRSMGSLRALLAGALALLAAALLFALPSGVAQASHLEAPGNVTVTPQPDGLLVEWDQVPDRNASRITTAYHLRYRVKSPQGAWQGNNALVFRILDGREGVTGCSASRCSFNLSNDFIRRASATRWGPYPQLVLGTEYEVQVSARGSRAAFGTGHDQWAAPVSAVPGAPAAPDPTVKSSYTGLTVTWSEPSDNGAEITGYSVQWKKSAESYWDPQYDSGVIPTLSTDIVGLDTGVLYDVRIRAQNSRGWSNWSPVLTDAVWVLYFPNRTQPAPEIDAHGLRHTRQYTVAIAPPLESDSAVHLRIKSTSTATYGEDYTMALPNAPGTTATKVLQLPAGASEASFGMWINPDQQAEGNESVHLELVAIENAPYTVEDAYKSNKFRDMEVVILDNSLPIPSDADPERGIDIQPESTTVRPTTTVSYTVSLASMPDSDVTVRAYLDTPDGAVNIGAAGSALSVSPASLTFNSSNWDTPQTFTVSAGDFPLSEEHESVVILHGLESDDPDYDTNYSFQGPGIDGETQITVTVSVGGL